MDALLEIDGRVGEGGGQVLRTALSLSVALGRAVRLTHVRGQRAKPGLLRQHLTALRAAAEISGGTAEGELGGSTIELHPGPVRAGDYTFRIGSAGSTLLVLQTVLPPLFLARKSSTLVLTGGTHNPLAPPFEFVARSFAPVLAAAGVGLELELVRPGFHPAGGGELRARVQPANRPVPLELLERGAPRAQRCSIGLAALPGSIAEREWATLVEELGCTGEQRRDVVFADSESPGNFLVFELEFERVTQVLSVLGERGLSAERVARRLAQAVRTARAAGAPVDEYLADQLMLPLALLAGGRYRTGEPSLHARTNAEIVNLFLPGAVAFEPLERGDWLVSVAARVAPTR